MHSLSEKKLEHYVELMTLNFGQVQDPRAYRGERAESLQSLLTVLVLGNTLGKRELRGVEDMVDDVGKKTRDALALQHAGVSDTTLYKCLKLTSPEGIEETLRQQIKGALVRKQVKNDIFAVGVASFDGKKTAHGKEKLPLGKCTQRKRENIDNEWMLLALRACLTSSSARPILGQRHLCNKEGESPAFRELFPEMVRAYPRLFQIVTVDAAFTNIANANLILDEHKDYIFCVKGNQEILESTIAQAFGGDDAWYGEEEDVDGKHISRFIRRRACPNTLIFSGAQQIIYLRQRSYCARENKMTCEDRYFISSIPMECFSDTEMLKLIRLHWGIENGPNWTCDVIFKEDTHFPCLKGHGPELTSWLMVLAYNVIAIVRSLCLVTRKTIRGGISTTRIPFSKLITKLFIHLVRGNFANLALNER